MYITALETVYAMTIHKSQGSEYDNVLVLLPEETDHELLTAELLYTAITRAKQKVVLQVSHQTLEKAIHSRVRRISGITERLNNNS
jgi:exodeoxyribonuclease V alpha subunit